MAYYCQYLPAKTHQEQKEIRHTYSVLGMEKTCVGDEYLEATEFILSKFRSINVKKKKKPNMTNSLKT